MLLLILSLIFLSFIIYFIFKLNFNEYYAGNVTIGKLSTIDPITFPPYQYNCVDGAPPYVDWCMYG